MLAQTPAMIPKAKRFNLDVLSVALASSLFLPWRRSPFFALLVPGPNFARTTTTDHRLLPTSNRSTVSKSVSSTISLLDGHLQKQGMNSSFYSNDDPYVEACTTGPPRRLCTSSRSTAFMRLTASTSFLFHAVIFPDAIGTAFSAFETGMCISKA